MRWKLRGAGGVVKTTDCLEVSGCAGSVFVEVDVFDVFVVVVDDDTCI